MVAARLFRAAGACLTMCPFVVCGGDGMPGRALQKHNGQSHRVRPHPGWAGFQFSLNSFGEACVVGTGSRRRDPGVCGSYREAVSRRSYPGYGDRVSRGNIVGCTARTERSVMLGRGGSGCRAGPYGCAGAHGISAAPAFTGIAFAASTSTSTTTPTGAGSSLAMLRATPYSSPGKSWSWRRSDGFRTNGWTRRRAPSFSPADCASASDPRPVLSLSYSMLLGRGDDALDDCTIFDNICSARGVRSQSGAKSSWAGVRGRGQRCRSRDQRRLRLEVVSAASSSSAGGLTASTGSDVNLRQELLEAFEGIKGDDELLDLEGFRNIPDIRDLLKEGLLRDSELDEIWGTTPKADASSGRVDFDGFCEAFARVDALFEEEEEEQVSTDASREEIPAETAAAAATAGVTEDGTALESAGVESAKEETPSTPEEVFVQIAGSKTGLLDFEGLLRSNEVQELRAEGLLALKEVESVWDGLPKASGAEGGSRASTRIDLEGFLEFDRKLGDLFEDEEEDEERENRENREEGLIAPKATSEATTSSALVSDAEAPTTEQEKEVFPSGSGVAEGSGQQDPLATQFMELTAATGDGVLGLDGLRKWKEVSELLDEDLLSIAELEKMWETLPKADGSGGKSIGLPGFLRFAQRLDEMFEVLEDSDGDQSSEDGKASNPAVMGVAGGFPQPEANTGVGDGRGAEAARAKARVLGLAKEEMVDCGMGCGERRRAEVLEAVEELVAVEEGNMVLEDDLGEELISALVGDWRLLYTSSSAIEYNQGLTGLANTLPNAKFRGLRQVLHVDGMVFDAEYEEELSIRDEAEPLVITVASDWEVKQTSSLVTGKSSVAVKVAPKQIKYGFITVRAERWKTLRAMTLLDIAYLDEDFRIMRGQTARQNIFIFSRC